MNPNPKPTHLQDSLTLEYFKSIREEIHLRLQQHNQLWFQKIVTCGVLISFALSNTGIAIYGCALVPYMAVVFDLLIVNNLGVIHHLGQYIAMIVERKHLPDGWETLSRRLSSRRFYGKIDWLIDWIIIVLFTSAIYLLSAFIVIYNDILWSNIVMTVLYAIALFAIVAVAIYSFMHLLYAPKIGE